MNNKNTVSRRRFLQSAGALGSTAYLRLLGPGLAAITQAACSAKQQQAAFKVLTAEEARTFAAVAARIIPTTDTPGATEAGVVHFFDNAFAAEMSDMLEEARTQLAQFDAALRETLPDSVAFSDLTEDEQDAFLKSQESTPFFEIAWIMTMFGFFSMEKYGGNKDLVGWDLIGFEGHHGAWQYPFGYYDAQVHEEIKHGG